MLPRLCQAMEPSTADLVANNLYVDFLHKSKRPDGDRTAFLDDLSNYMPFGSLKFSSPYPLLGTYGEKSYGELNEVPHVLNGHPVYKPLRHLLECRWARLFVLEGECKDPWIRIYILPYDVGRRHVQRDDPVANRYVMILFGMLDLSPHTWHGRLTTDDKHLPQRKLRDSQNEESLFYIFNTIPSPNVESLRASEPFSNEAIRTILHEPRMPGLKTNLYPYQKRTVATMIRREVEPARALDPRLRAVDGPSGKLFFYDSETGEVLRDKREYEEVSGGILGESMGLGKTLICLALVLATRGHWPVVPPEYSESMHPVRPATGSLMQMAATATLQSRIPWRPLFQTLTASGDKHDNCISLLEQNDPQYIIPAPPTREFRRRLSAHSASKTVQLCSATLIIVPQNLFDQWKNEIKRHVDEDEKWLKVLSLDSNGKNQVPDSKQLLDYDIVLMTRQRLEREIVPPESLRFTLESPKEYHSPLKDLHFLRVIMDEGHEFASRTKSYWAIQQLHVDRKWIVSGTPAGSLIGVEVGTAAVQTSATESPDELEDVNSEILLKRRHEMAFQQEKKDLEKLGGIVVGFFKLRPWANSKEDDPASWSKRIMPFENGRRKPRSLRTLLESLVVRHRIEDVEIDLKLPPLHNKLVHLQPCWYDKLSINLFILTLVANAVTSERTDEDYMFHTKNRHNLNQLINNLRQSGFYWTSFKPEEIQKTLNLSRAYLDEHSKPGSSCPIHDRVLLESAVRIGELVLRSAPWKAFAAVHEMGTYVEGFPSVAQDAWSLVHKRKYRPGAEQGDGPLMTGVTQLLKAQQWVDTHLYMNDLTQSLADLGSTTMHKLWTEGQRSETDKTSQTTVITPTKRSSAQSNLGSTGTPRLTEKHTISRPKISISSKKAKKLHPESPTAPKPLKSALKSSSNTAPEATIPADSPLAPTKMIGTVSAKLSYLLDQIVTLYIDEKILVFYEGDHIAWYLAQGLDLLSIRYLIYTPKLAQVRQNAYITTFNGTDTFRVLLMDVNLAAHGLHIASASRIFFVNPVWQPNVEAQAIKRAHRIGQTRPVYVETLVLQDTLEDHMLQRRRNMTAQEHLKAEKSLLDDEPMGEIIKRATFIPVCEEELDNVDKQIARLKVPQQLFGRNNRVTTGVDDPDADLIFPAGSSPKSGSRRKFEDDTDLNVDASAKRNTGSKMHASLQNTPPSPKWQQVTDPLTPTPTMPPRAQCWSSSFKSASRESSLQTPPPTQGRRVGFALPDDSEELPPLEHGLVYTSNDSPEPYQNRFDWDRGQTMRSRMLFDTDDEPAHIRPPPSPSRLAPNPNLYSRSASSIDWNTNVEVSVGSQNRAEASVFGDGFSYGRPSSHEVDGKEGGGGSSGGRASHWNHPG